MRKIYQSDKVAWIGDSAPIPDGWSLEPQPIKAPVNSAPTVVPLIIKRGRPKKA